MKKTLNKAALSQTTEEYASRSSIHGIGYIFDKELHLLERLLWLLLVIAFLGVAATMIWNFWSQWRNEQVTKDIFLSTLASLRPREQNNFSNFRWGQKCTKTAKWTIIAHKGPKKGTNNANLVT